MKVLHRLPLSRMETCKRITVRVSRNSTIWVNHNVYVVNSRLIGERVEIRLYVEHVEVWYGQRCIDQFPRLRGEGKHYINYRHIIDWLLRKPGAFENYRYRNDLFPTHRFRMAYDELKRHNPHSATRDREYLRILHLAAHENETAVDKALHYLIDQGKTITAESVKALVHEETMVSFYPENVFVSEVDLHAYDELLSAQGIPAMRDGNGGEVVS